MITPQTTLWRAWIGFNASHSLAAILFGLAKLYWFVTPLAGTSAALVCFLACVALR